MSSWCKMLQPCLTRHKVLIVQQLYKLYASSKYDRTIPQVHQTILKIHAVLPKEQTGGTEIPEINNEPFKKQRMSPLIILS